MTKTGRCLCESLKYVAQGEPLKVGNCYCIDCQHETGAGHLTWLVYPGEAVTLEGECKTYTKRGDSGEEITRTFCPNCGTTVIGEPDLIGDVKIVRAGTLDDTTGISAEVSFFASRSCSWDLPPDDVPKLAEMADPG